MRDDFSAAVKDLLAKRVGFRCSNPACRQSTAGPQADPAKAVNLGVGAHITAASPGGPRYDPSLTPEQRASAENGIWLCQNDGKLIDNDVTRFTVELLKSWKAQAEATAAQELSRRINRFPDASAKFERLERLLGALLAEIRQDLAQFPLRRELVLLKRAWSYWAGGNELIYYYDDHPDLDDKVRLLENEDLVEEITYNNTKQYIISEQLADYLGAP
jgi:hypothetical protein